MDTPPPSHPMSRTARLVTSGAVWFGTFAFGLTYNFLAPALIELKNKYETSIEDISKVFTIILIAYMTGALICSFIYKYVNRQLAVVLLLYTIAAMIIIIPHLPSKLHLFIAGGILGFASGGYDTSQIAWILEMWQLKAGLYVQIQHFSWAFGTMITPLLLKPFLMEESKNHHKAGHTFNGANSTVAITPQESRLYIPFAIGGGIVALSSTIILALFCYKRYEQPSSTTPGSSQEIVSTTEETSRGWNCKKVVLIGLTAAFLGCYQGMEVCTFQFLPTFTHYIDLKLPEPEGASILSELTIAFTAGRFLGIIGSIFKLTPAIILAGNLVCMVLGDFILYYYSNDSLTALRAAAILLGLGFSTIFPCIYDHVEKHFKVTNVVAAIMVVAGAVVSSIYPLIVGHAVEQNPFVLTYVIIFSVAVSAVAFLVLYCLTEGLCKWSRRGSIHVSKGVE